MRLGTADDQQCDRYAARNGLQGLAACRSEPQTTIAKAGTKPVRVCDGGRNDPSRRQKKLGRFRTIGKRILNDGKRHSPRAGWQDVHVAIDDHSRSLVTEIYPTEDADSCTQHLHKAANELAERGISVERVVTDHGPGSTSHAFKAAITKLGLRDIKTKP